MPLPHGRDPASVVPVGKECGRRFRTGDSGILTSGKVAEWCCGYLVARFRRITPTPSVSVPIATPLLTSAHAADHLGISVLTLYDWLTQSDSGEFQIRGQQVTIDYFQGGRRGQGRIKLSDHEVQRLLNLMRVQPKPPRTRRSVPSKRSLQHITTTLGRPDD